MKQLLLALTITFTMLACSSETGELAGPVKVEVVRTDSGYQLLRDGKRYTVRGAGMGVDDIERFAANGGNSIRTWSTLNEGTKELLDKAHAHGVTVALGLPVKAERHGFDYNDPEAVAGQLETVREEVLKYKDHPAVLAWLIGNELNHSYTNPKVWNAVNEIATMIHEVDPYHPASSTLAGFHADVVAEILARDALQRNESCGGHFREDHQTPEGEALRDDENFAYVAAWEYTGPNSEPRVNKEHLEFENIHLATRSYK